MNDEIKEHMQNCIDREESCLLNSDNTKRLLDYITNLQETIDFQDKWLEYYKDFISENNIKDYKLRIDKAVEYIKQLEHSEWITFGRKILLDILNGEDNE